MHLLSSSVCGSQPLHFFRRAIRGPELCIDLVGLVPHSTGFESKYQRMLPINRHAHSGSSSTSVFTLLHHRDLSRIKMCRRTLGICRDVGTEHDAFQFVSKQRPMKSVASLDIHLQEFWHCACYLAIERGLRVKV